jgi:hypothetical protein
MSRQVIKLDLAKDSPPLLSKSTGLTAFIQGLGSSIMQPGKNPQPIFVENAFPTTYGWQSFGLTTMVTAGLNLGFDEMYRVQDTTGAMGLLVPNADGKCYLWRQGTPVWTALLPTAVYTVPFNSTMATYGNQSYLCISGTGTNASYGIYRVNVAAGTLTQLRMYTQGVTSTMTAAAATISRATGSYITDGWYAGMSISGSGIPAGATILSLTATVVTMSVAATSTNTSLASVSSSLGIAGLSDTPGAYALGSILGITSSANYLIAWNSQTIFWSSILTALDFTPSLISGSGSGIPTDLQGTITACYPITNGFLITTTELVLSAQYSGNSTYPWIFKSVSGGSPPISAETVTHDMVDSTQIAFTASGMISMDANQATPQSAELSDFLNSNKLESYNPTLGYPVVTAHTGYKKVKVTRIGTRYLCVSFGAPVVGNQIYTHCFLYDLVLKQTGKFKGDHVEIFAWPFAFSGSEIEIAALSADGTVNLLDPQAVTHTGVFIFGRIALTRNSTCTVQHVQAEGVTNMQDILLLDGANESSVVSMYQQTPGFFNGRATAKAHNLCVLGKFSLSFLEVVIHQAGSR